MAFGADDEKAARLADLVRLAGDLLAVLFQRLCKHVARVEDLLIVRFGVAGRLGNQFIGKACLAQVVLRHVFGVTAEHDIGTTACHVRCDRNRAEFTGLRDDLGFLFVVLRVQEVVLDALAGEKIGELFVLLDRHRADQNGLPLGVAFFHLLDDGAILCRLGLVDDVGVVDTGDGTVCRDLDDVEVIDCAEFFFLRQCRTGHTGELAVEAEVVLEGDGRKGLALACDLHVLLGLDRLMKTFAVAAAEHQSAGELVDDDDLTVLDDIVDIALHRAVGLDGLVDVVRDGGVFGIGEVFKAEVFLGLLHAAGGERRGLGLFVDDVVGVDVDVFLFLVVALGDDLLAEAAYKVFRAGIHLRGLFAHAGDDERRARLIDQNGVDLVDDGEGVSALDKLACVDGHVVAQVIKAHFVIRAVGDVRGVGLAALFTCEVVDDQADRQP